jgi:NTE family protein
MAHIGALRVIERAGIQIDYISGTSMGAIIGAMYALGYSVDEIEAYMRQVDWDALLTNEVPRNRLSFFDRKSDSRYLLSFPIKDNKPRLPVGLNYGQYILKELSFLSQTAYQYPSFKDFPIPFTCVATDLETGKACVFNDGTLLDALRASTAFPSLFTPYELNGHLYVDGGVVNNYPVQQLKDKGVDYIIGVDVQDLLYTKDELNTMVRVLEQTSSFIKASDFQEQLKLTDVFIKPDLPEVGLTTFDRFDEIVKKGEEAALNQLSALMELAEKSPKSPVQRNLYKARPPKALYIQNIEITGLKNNTRNYVLGKLRIQEEAMVTQEKINQGLDQLYGSQYFKYVSYALREADTGYVFELHLTESSSLAQFRVGLNYNDDYKTALLLNYTKRNLFFKNDRLSADVAIGDAPRALLNYFVDRGFIPTLGVKFRSNRFTFRTYNSGAPILQRVYQDFSLDFFIQSTFYDAYAVGGGIQLENVDINQDLNFAGVDGLNKSYLNYYGFIDFDSFDDAEFPKQGFSLLAQGRIIAEQRGFEKFLEPSSVIDLSYSQAFSISSKVSLVTKVWGASTVGPDLDDPYKLYLGSMGKEYVNYIQPFIGYRYMELIGRNALVLRADLFYEVYKNHYITAKGNLGKLEPTFNSLFGSDVLLDGYSIGYSYNSALGPLAVNLAGSTNHARLYTYVRLGFWF